MIMIPPNKIGVVMEHVSKDDILTAITILILFIAAMITFTVYSWLVLLAIILVIFSWYYRS
ncbi:MAG: hypothetical protein LUO93_04900 [Methanomicrobiales archaeon]|nr:hypothetical protein [Methanomicrobiales archaeon]